MDFARSRQIRCRERFFGAWAPRWSVRRCEGRARSRRRSCRTRWCAAGAVRRGSRRVRRPRRDTHWSAGTPSRVSAADSSEPPASDCSSISATRAPARAAFRAAVSPVGPAPITSTSTWWCTASYRAGSGIQAEPALAGDAVRDEAVVQLDGGGQHHRFGVRLLDLYQPAGVLGPGRGDAAGSAQLDAGGDLVPTGGQQRRRQGVPGVTGEVLAVEGELEGGAAVDAAAVRGAEAREGVVTGSPAWARRGGTRSRSGRWRCRGGR